MNFTKIEKCMEVNAQNIDVVNKNHYRIKKGKLKSCFLSSYIIYYYIIIFQHIFLKTIYNFY